MCQPMSLGLTHEEGLLIECKKVPRYPTRRQQKANWLQV
jgi:hypothetical protein